MDVCESPPADRAASLAVREAPSAITVFPINFTREDLCEVQAGYRVFGEEDNVQQDTWPAGHEWHGAMAYPFIDRVLGGRAAK